jgi:hypothetical protein
MSEEKKVEVTATPTEDTTPEEVTTPAVEVETTPVEDTEEKA